MSPKQGFEEELVDLEERFELIAVTDDRSVQTNPLPMKFKLR